MKKNGIDLAVIFCIYTHFKYVYFQPMYSEDDHPEIVRATLEPKTADYSIGKQFDYSKPLTLCSSNHHFAQFQSRVQHVSDNFYLQGQIEYLNQTRDLKQTVPLPLVEFSLDQVSLEWYYILKGQCDDNKRYYTFKRILKL